MATAAGEGEGEAPQVGGPEIAFFDVETSIPQRPGQGYALLEFGAILVCPRSLVEVACYTTLVRPPDLGVVSPASVRCNGITRDALATAPSFVAVADAVYDLLHGRVWAGHNILRFDLPRVREAFNEIGRSPPEPKGTIDTLPLLTQRFGRRAGDMKMASLANYFGLGRQKHRSLDDVRMNLEVVKYCATVLFLEASLPEVLTVENLVERATTRSKTNGTPSPEAKNSERATTRSKTNGTPSPEAKNSERASTRSKTNGTPPEMKKSEANSSPDSSKRQCTMPKVHNSAPEDGDNLQESVQQPAMNRDPTDELISQIEEMKLGSTTTQMDASPSGYSGFLEPNDVSTECIKISVGPSYYHTQRFIKHKDSPLRLCCAGLKVQFGVNTKFLDNAGRPKLSIVVDIPEDLSEVLEFCDNLAQRSLEESGSTSEWRPLVKRYGYVNRPTVRLNIPTTIVSSSGASIYSADMYKKEPSGNTQKLAFGKVDAAELDSLFVRGSTLDAFFSLEMYDYQQNAGVRLLAKRLVVHSESRQP